MHFTLKLEAYCKNALFHVLYSDALKPKVIVVKSWKNMNMGCSMSACGHIVRDNVQQIDHFGEKKNQIG